jgi:HAD superfamily hydrolase (TIGR01509 family)
MVVFDLDGVLIDTEPTWDAARRAVAFDLGGTWSDSATTDMMGMSSSEWSRYLHDRLGARADPTEIVRRVERRVLAALQDDVPWIAGARQAVERLGAALPVGIASSANRSVIDLAVERGNLGRFVQVSVSSEEVEHGKPQPDVYLEAARRLGRPPAEGVAVEDSTNGLYSAAGAGFAVIAFPNRRFPPDAAALELAADVIASLDELTVERVGVARAG